MVVFPVPSSRGWSVCPSIAVVLTFIPGKNPAVEATCKEKLLARVAIAAPLLKVLAVPVTNVPVDT